MKNNVDNKLYLMVIKCEDGKLNGPEFGSRHKEIFRISDGEYSPVPVAARSKA
jgi:hypothetical protein